MENWDFTQGEPNVGSLFIAATSMHLYMFLLFQERLKFKEEKHVSFFGLENLTKVLFGWLGSSWWIEATLTECDKDYAKRLICASNVLGLELNSDKEQPDIYDTERQLLGQPNVKQWIDEGFKAFDPDFIWKIESYQEEDKQNCLAFLKSVSHIHQLRLQIKNTYFIGLLGPQNNGKTSALHYVFGISDPNNAPGDSPTLSPRGYSLGKPESSSRNNFHVIDFPAYNDQSPETRTQQDLIFSFFVVSAVFLDSKSADTASSLELVKGIMTNGQGLRMVFITHMDLVSRPLRIPKDLGENYLDDPNEESSHEDDYPEVAEARFERLKSLLISKIHRPFPIFPVCLKATGAKFLRQHKLFSKFDAQQKTASFDDPLESKFVIYGPRGVRRIIWEYSKFLFKEPDLFVEWKNILCR